MGDQSEAGQQERDTDDARCVPEPVREGGVRLHQYEVPDARGIRPLEGNRGADHHDRVQVRRDDDRPREPTLETAARESKQQVVEDRDEEWSEEEPDRVDGGDARVDEKAREPG
jgi:hypothetical protein